MRQAGYLTLPGAIDVDSGRSFSPGPVVIREYHRFEGVSDPDDMSIVYAIEGQGGVGGTSTAEGLVVLRH